MSVQSRVKVLLWLQAFALLAGNFVGWSTVASEVKNYCDVLGQGLWSLTDFSGSATTNPLLTPCFWGSIAFALALVWTIWLIVQKDFARQRAHIERLWWLLLAGTLFALANNVPVFYNFYTHPGGGVSCSAGVVKNPFLTSCFMGLIAFFAAFTFATFAKFATSKTAPRDRGAAKRSQ